MRHPRNFLCRAAALAVGSRFFLRLQSGPCASHLTFTTPTQANPIEGLLRRVRACNDGAELASQAVPFIIPGAGPVGVILPKAAHELARFPNIFRVTSSAVELVDGESSVEKRSGAVNDVLQELRESGRIPMLQGWRDEKWPVKADFDAPAELVIERAAGPLFGVRGFGCHVNGLVLDKEEGTGKIKSSSLWVAKRAMTKPTYPGKLDHIVAGGLSHGENPADNVIRESAEEASIPMELARAALPAGIVQYCQVDETGWGVKRDVLFCYDLELPSGFDPVAGDGEVQAFELWDIDRVLQSLSVENDEWKPNVAVVIIDMLVRRGLLSPDQPGYVELIRSLRQ